MTLPDLHVLPSDTLMRAANGVGPDLCLYCLRPVAAPHRPSCVVTKERVRNANPEPPKYRFIPVEE